MHFQVLLYFINGKKVQPVRRFNFFAAISKHLGYVERENEVLAGSSKLEIENVLKKSFIEADRKLQLVSCHTGNPF